jgi:hypothetical protein
MNIQFKKWKKSRSAQVPKAYGEQLFGIGKDVEIGEELTPVIFGPLTLNEMIVWIVGGGNLMNKSDRLWRFIYDQYPDAELGFYDPKLKINLNLELPHFDKECANQVGAPGVYDFGSQRISCLSCPSDQLDGRRRFLVEVQGGVTSIQHYRRYHLVQRKSYT